MSRPTSVRDALIWLGADVSSEREETAAIGVDQLGYAWTVVLRGSDEWCGSAIDQHPTGAIGVSALRGGNAVHG